MPSTPIDCASDSEDWNLPEKLSRLNITAPPDWNDYNEYLLAGGELEYEDWTTLPTSGMRGDR